MKKPFLGVAYYPEDWDESEIDYDISMMQKAGTDASMLFPLRSAIVASLTIPLSTFVSVAIMYMVGIELNIVTLAALIVVMGMIVDNSIVVIDGYLEYLGKGYAPHKAAIESARQYFVPMMLATICICARVSFLIMVVAG